MLYRLCALHFSPEHIHYFLQQRETEDQPWSTIHTVSTAQFTEAERTEFIKA